jgi:hypothetical protein
MILDLDRPALAPPAIGTLRRSIAKKQRAAADDGQYAENALPHAALLVSLGRRFPQVAARLGIDVDPAIGIEGGNRLCGRESFAIGGLNA